MRSWFRGRTKQKKMEYVTTRKKAEIVKREVNLVTGNIGEKLKDNANGERKKKFRLAKTYK